MSKLDRLYIAATGMITPVGMNTEMTAASVKAGVSAYKFSEFHYGNNAIKMASVPEDALQPLSPDLSVAELTSRQARMLRLSQAAFDQLPIISEPVALFLAGPEPRPDSPLPMRSKFLQHLQLQTEVEFDIENSKVFPMGRAAGFYALEYAFNYLESSGKQYVLVGGVDTCKDVMNLSYLANENRIQTELGEADAFVPGEGACFLLLASEQSANENRQICRPGISEEPGHLYSEEPYQGDGLSNAFTQSIAMSGVTNIQNIYSSFNGESFAAKEYGVAITRNSSAFSIDCKHLHPGDCFGDLGAAASVALLALSTELSITPVLCFSSSDDEFRGAACIV